MHRQRTTSQQHLYQQQLLQQQQQQMSQYSGGLAVEASTSQIQSPASISSTSQIPPYASTSYPPTPRQQAAVTTAGVTGPLGNSAGSSTSRMGPPMPIQASQAAIANGNLLGLGVNGQASGNLFPMYASSSMASESSPYLGPGAGLMRLHQYSEALKEGPDRHTLDYWRAFADEFFTPQSMMHLILCNPATREQKAFEVPASVIARWMHINYISGVKKSSISMESPREYLFGQPFPPPPRMIRADFHLPSGNVTHFVECKRALSINHFDDGWQVQMNGLLRAAMVPHTRPFPPSATLKRGNLATQTQLRFESLELVYNSHRSFLAIESSLPILQKTEKQIPMSVVRDILSSHGHHVTSPKQDPSSTTTTTTTTDAKRLGRPAGSTKVEDSVEERSNFSITVQEASLPESPVNEYGITLRAMRFLEITESICQLRDLMEFSTSEIEAHLGPLEGLRRLAMQYRERESTSTKGGSNARDALRSDATEPFSAGHGESGSAGLVSGTKAASTKSASAVEPEGVNVNNRERSSVVAPSPGAAAKAGGSPAKKQRQ